LTWHPDYTAATQLERSTVHNRPRTTAHLCLALLIPLIAAGNGGSAHECIEQDGTSKTGGDQDTPGKESSDPSSTPQKAPRRGKSARKKPDRESSPGTTSERIDGLSMEPGIVCKSIDGYEDYEPLPNAAQTSDEKLLVYIRPLGFQTEKVEKGYQSHLTLDGEVRKRGQKTILRQKKNLLDYKPVFASPTRFIYLKQSVSLKGLAPGDYDLRIILHDEIAKGAPASQVVKFKIIPAADPRKAKDTNPPG
jgi:hypothetical protein